MAQDIFGTISNLIQDYMIDKGTADNITQDILNTFQVSEIKEEDIPWWDKED